MKKFVLITHSESGDDYTYLIEHPQEPTNEELRWFLQENACDQNEDTIYEHIQDIVALDGEFMKIPEAAPNQKEFL